MKPQQQPQLQPQPQQIERKVKEKIRREHLKKLYSILTSLLPPNPSMGRMTMPEKVDEAVEYIKGLQQQLKEAQERKEMLMSPGGRRARSYTTTTTTTTTTKSISPKIEIHELGSGLEVVLVTGFEHQFMFHEVIRILNEETVEVLNANLCTVGDTVYHTVHGKIEESMFCFRAETIRKKLNKLVSLEMEEKDQQQAEQPQQQWCMWDDEIRFDNWDFTGIN